MTDYNNYVRQDRRLEILLLLRGISVRRANQHVLRTSLRSRGYDELVETVENDLHWLTSQGLIKTEQMDGGIVLAVLTDYGDQVARGVVRVAGVAVPAE